MSFFSKIKYTGRLYPLLIMAALVSGCAGKASEQQADSPKQLPVLTITSSDAVINTEYPARIEGRVNVDIRSQADGYIEHIFVDEGTYVKAGQALFKIHDRPLVEQLNTAQAALQAANASLSSAALEVQRYEDLSQNKVVSDFQLKAAQAAYENAKASVAQNAAAVEAAKVNLSFALIKAPVNGYIGRIPKRIGNLVTKNDALPLTTLSDIQEVYAYFSMTEKDFLRFAHQNTEKKFSDKVAAMPAISLLLADGSPYKHSGKIQMIDGQFDNTTGAISVRAVFANPEGLLRSGNTGRIVFPEKFQEVLLVPVLATQDIQHKRFVYRLTSDNRAERVAIEVAGKSGDFYILKNGLKAGDRIITKDLEYIEEGAVIIPLS
jgi:membrane fusion protein (multidrug efflux system)